MDTHHAIELLLVKFLSNRKLRAIKIGKKFGEHFLGNGVS